MPELDPAGHPDPSFTVLGAEAVPRCATPTMRFRIGVEDASGSEVELIALTVLIVIEPGKRTYSTGDRERLTELFGEPERWGSTTGSFRWTQQQALAGPFSGSVLLDLDVPCTYDHEVAAAKYFGGVDSGAYPLQFHFNGTVHFRDAAGRPQILPLAWDRSARFELPVETWRAMIDAHYPGGTWVHLEEETMHELGRLKARSGSPTVDAAIRGLLAAADADVGGADAEAGETPIEGARG